VSLHPGGRRRPSSSPTASAREWLDPGTDPLMVLGSEPRARLLRSSTFSKSAAPAAEPGQSLEGTGELIHRGVVNRGCSARVAARGLGSLLCWYLRVQGRQQLGVDIRRLARVRADKKDEGVILRSPGGEEAVVAVEMAAADVIEDRASQSVSGRRRNRWRRSLRWLPLRPWLVASKRLQLLASGRRQRDLDGRLRLPGIRSSRSSTRTGVSRPAATSSSAWCSNASSSTALSLSRRITASRSGRWS
jgi:hypothetical protein